MLFLEAELLEKKRELEQLNLELARERLEKDSFKEKTVELENWLSVFSEMNMSQDHNRIMLRVNAVGDPRQIIRSGPKSDRRTTNRKVSTEA